MRVRSMSALPPKADIAQHGGNVRFVPIADVDHRRCLSLLVDVCRFGSDFKFEADLHNLRARDLEICAWSLGIMMHECENLFTPARHAQSPG
jgi:hypothetical protein